MSSFTIRGRDLRGGGFEARLIVDRKLVSTKKFPAGDRDGFVWDCDYKLNEALLLTNGKKK